MLAERGYFTIELDEGKKVPLRFSTWALMRFCELKGDLSLTDLFNTLGTGGATLKDFVLLIKAGAESATDGYSPTDKEVCNWIDAMGGMGSSEFKRLCDVLAKSMVDEGAKKKKMEKAA